MYIVLKLKTEFSVTDVFEKKHNVSVDNEQVAGYCPIFKDWDRAVLESEDGKYRILKIKTYEPN